MEIRIRAIIELLGSPKEHIENTMKKVMEELKTKDNVQIVKNDTSAAKESKEMANFYSIFTELELKMDDFNALNSFCFDFMPSSVEILEPAEFKMSDKELEDMLNDLLAKLHQQSMIVRNLHAENTMMKQKLNGGE